MLCLQDDSRHQGYRVNKIPCFQEGYVFLGEIINLSYDIPDSNEYFGENSAGKRSGDTSKGVHFYAGWVKSDI